jgi:C-terminal processing protease CtpA/Prc
MDQKGYELSIEPKEGYLLITAVGLRTRETVSAMTREVFDAAVTHEKKSVVIDVRQMRGGFGIMDIYLLVSDVFETLRGKGIQRAAVVDVRSSPMREAFLETAARNRGFNLRVFADTEEAEQWMA